MRTSPSSRPASVARRISSWSMSVANRVRGGGVFRRVLCGLFCLLAAAQSAPGQPELVLQMGHSDLVLAVALSPDGKLVASGSRDQTIKIWDVATGLELRTLLGHGNTVRRLAFSPDGRKLASAGTSDQTARLWNVETGEHKVLKEKTPWNLSDPEFSSKESPDEEEGSEESGINYYEGTTAVAFSPDGRTVVTSNYKALKVWDAENGKLLRTFINHTDWVYTVAFSADGARILSAGRDKTIKISDATTGRVLTSIKTAADDSKEDFIINAVTFAPGEKFIASGDSDGKVKIWEVETGQKKKELDGDEHSVETVIYLASGSLLASGGMDGAVKLWDLSGDQVSKRTLTGHADSVESLAYSPTAKLLVSGSEDKTIRLWEVESGKPVRVLRGKTSKVSSVGFAHRAPMLAIGYRDSYIKLVDLEKGEGKTLDARPASTPDPKNAFAEAFIEFQYGGLLEIAISPDDKLLASGNRDIKLWEVNSGRLLHTIPTGDTTVTSFAFSPDGSRLASNGVPTGVIRLWDTATGSKIRDLAGHDSPVNTLTFSPNGQLLASGGRDKTVRLWSLTDSKPIATLTGHDVQLYKVFFTTDGEKLISLSGDGAIRVWSVGTQQLLASFSIKDADAREKRRQLFPRLKNDDETDYDSKFDIKADSKGSVYIYNAKSEKLLATLFRLDDDWAVVTPEGFFDGPPAAWKQLLWRFNNNTFDYGASELYFSDFFYPNLLQAILTGNLPQPKSGHDLARIDRRQPRVEITGVNGQARGALDAQPATERRMATVTVEVVDNVGEKKQPTHHDTSGAQDLRLFRNGSLVKVWHNDLFNSDRRDGCEQAAPPRPGQPRRVLCRAEVPVVAGANTFTAYAFNADNVKSGDDTLTINGAAALKREGTLYVLAVGVDRYANAAYDLKFAVKDVVDIGDALKSHQAQIREDAAARQYAGTQVITLTDQNATKSNIMAALALLGGQPGRELPEGTAEAVRLELSKIKPTQPEDALLVYFAGHGTSQGTWPEQRYYLLPHDFTGAGAKSLEQQGISDLELNQALERIGAERVLMVIDACQSGQALGEQNAGRAPMNSKGLAQLAYDKGMAVLAAAQSHQAALEAVAIPGRGEIRHGLLTYALLQAFNDPLADRDGNTQVWEQEWLSYAVDLVPSLQRQAMVQRQADIKNMTKRTDFFYDDDDKTPDAGKRAVQTPRLFTRSGAGVKPLIIVKR
ncbi:MAG: caspase family protein [Pyrinomonadaceae bacterium]